mgnify:CR=1 FL=1|jgi:hypothetical protein
MLGKIDEQLTCIVARSIHEFLGKKKVFNIAAEYFLSFLG